MVSWGLCAYSDKYGTWYADMPVGLGYPHRTLSLGVFNDGSGFKMSKSSCIS